MSEPFRNRRFTPVEPGRRPRRQRTAARVIVTDTTSVLMLADTDPGIAGSRWWSTPGGGIDPGESPVQAALRELAEETGRQVTEADLVGPVAVRDVVHGYSDQILAQRESFFVLFTEPFELDTAGHTESEKLTLDGHAWLRLDELDLQSDPVWPADVRELIDLARQPERWPVDLGEIEESTLPVNCAE